MQTVVEDSLETLLEHHLSPAALVWARPTLASMADLAAGPLRELAELADQNPPTLRPRTPQGDPVDRVDFHPAYLEMRRLAYCEEGMIANYYDPALRSVLGEGREVVKFAQGYLFSQAEQGLYCPICMTDGAAYLVERHATADQKERFLPHLTARRPEQLWEGSMFLTEREGGSDVGALVTRAVPEGEGRYRLYGEKWFCSNAGSELSMVLARPEGAQSGTRGLGLFALRRHAPDGSLNHQRLTRLKNKLGTRSMPTGELVLEGALAEAIGEPGRGFVHMTDMLNLSRLYNATAALGLARRALDESLSWCRTRRAFGRRLLDYPMVRAQLAELIVEHEASLHLFFEVAARRGRELEGTASREDRCLVRLATPLLKFHTAHLAVRTASAAVELHGGNGYIEDWPLARLYRDAQVLPIWEGTTNILVLDALRALRDDECRQALWSFLERQGPAQEVSRLSSALDRLAPEAPAARLWCDRLIAALQASLLVARGPRQVAELYLLKHFPPERDDFDPPFLRAAAELRLG